MAQRLELALNDDLVDLVIFGHQNAVMLLAGGGGGGRGRGGGHVCQRLVFQHAQRKTQLGWQHGRALDHHQPLLPLAHMGIAPTCQRDHPHGGELPAHLRQSRVILALFRGENNHRGAAMTGAKFQQLGWGLHKQRPVCPRRKIGLPHGLRGPGGLIHRKTNLAGRQHIETAAGLGQGQIYGKFCPLGQGRFHPHLALHFADQLMHNRQPQPRAAIAPRCHRLGLLERLEELFKKLGRNANAIIAKNQPHLPRAAAPYLEAHLALGLVGGAA